jgi:hypothetical protein
LHICQDVAAKGGSKGWVVTLGICLSEHIKPRTTNLKKGNEKKERIER